jgi:hypothetical protein
MQSEETNRPRPISLSAKPPKLTTAQENRNLRKYYANKDVNFEHFRTMAAAGASITSICTYLGVSAGEMENMVIKVLNMNLRQFYQRCKSEGDIRILTTQQKVAERGDVRMLIHLGKNRLGQHDGIRPQAEDDSISADQLQALIREMTPEDVEKAYQQALLTEAGPSPDTKELYSDGDDDYATEV